jgi:hypothetical protein
MAKEWKKIQRSDEDYTGKVTGTIDGTSVADIKTGAAAGVAVKVITDDAFDSNKKLKESNAADGLKNSNTTATDVGLENVANENPATLKATMSLNNVENKDQATILGGAFTGTIGGTSATDIKSGAAAGATANQDDTATILGGNLTGSINGTTGSTVVSNAADGALIKPAFDTSGSSPIIKADNAPSTLKNASVSINSDGTLSGAGSGQVSATGLGAIKTDLANAPTTIVNSNTTASDVGLDQVTNESKTTMFSSPTFSGTVAGVSKAHVGLSAVDNTADSAKPVSTAQATSIATKAPTANPTFTGTVAGVSSTHVGLGNVVNQAITVASGKIKFDGTSQTIDADKLGGKTSGETETSAASTAESNILDGAPAGLRTLNELAAALNDDASFNTTVTNSIATKGPAPLTLTAEDVDGDATFSSSANTPANLVVGQVGIFGGNQYVVVDV